MSSVFFYIIGSFIILTALLSVTSRRIFRSAIWLLFSLIGIAGFYFWLRVEFIAAVQIVVYVGGIVVLIIFSIFLTEQSGKRMPLPKTGRLIASILAVMFGGASLLLIIHERSFLSAPEDFEWTMKSIGYQMLNPGRAGYALPFEVVSLLLLAAMIGCIVIAMRSKPTSNE